MPKPECNKKETHQVFCRYFSTLLKSNLFWEVLLDGGGGINYGCGPPHKESAILAIRPAKTHFVFRHVPHEHNYISLFERNYIPYCHWITAKLVMVSAKSQNILVKFSSLSNLHLPIAISRFLTMMEVVPNPPQIPFLMHTNITIWRTDWMLHFVVVTTHKARDLGPQMFVRSGGYRCASDNSNPLRPLRSLCFCW